MLMTTSQGSHLTVARDGIFIMLSPSTAASEMDADLGLSLWQVLAHAEPLPRALALLLSGGIAGAPDFAMVRKTALGLHIIVRAKASVHTIDPFGQRQVVSGQAVNTWNETTLEGDLEFAVSLSNHAPGLCGVEPCRLASGVTRAGALISANWVPEQGANDHLDQVKLQLDPPFETPDLGDSSGAVTTADLTPPVYDQPTVAFEASSTEAPTETEVADHTILTNNLVEVRAQMATGVIPAVPAPCPILVMHTGERVPLSQPVLIGRAPSVTRVSGRELPRLITVASPNNDISRTHVQVRFEGDLIMVTDLNSTNGVILSEPQHGPRRLHPDEPTPVPAQAIVDLGDGVFFRVETGL